jgi:hypothetical protein
VVKHDIRDKGTAFYLCWISGSNGDDYQECDFLGFNAIQFGESRTYHLYLQYQG